MATAALDLIREFEGYREAPYWDVNAHRAGYGSDTMTLADGTVVPITPETMVDRDAAERDLERRVQTEFMPRAAQAIGQDMFAGLSPEQQAALTSITYNYGSLPSGVVAASRTGDPAQIERAIRGLAGHNDGINADRRNREADIFAGSAGIAGGPERVYQANSTETQGVTPEAVQSVYDAYQSGAMSDPDMRAEYEAAIRDGTFNLPGGVDGLPSVEAAAPEATATPQQVQNIYDAYISGAMMTEQAAEYQSAIQSGSFPLPEGVTSLTDTAAPATPDAPEESRGFWQTIKDNVVGDDDPTTFNTGEKIGQMLNNAGESMTFGLIGDEATATAGAALGGDYDTILENQRANQENFREQNPALSLASDVAPAFLPGAAVARGVQGATGLGRAAYGALAGGAGGAAYGFMEGEGDAQTRAANSVTTGALGSVFGAAAPRVMDALAAAPRAVQRAFQRSTERPTVEALQAMKNAAYTQVDQAGIRFSGDDMTNLSSRVQQIFSDSNYDEVADTASGAVLRQLRGKEGQETTLGQLDRVRQGLWRRQATAPDQPQILDAIEEIDNLIASYPSADGLMDLARTANATFSKSQLLEQAFDRASRSTSVSGSGGNVANNYMRAVNSILNNSRQMRFFNDAEEAAMRSFVSMADEGGPRLRRLIGKMSPGGNGLMMMLHGIGGVATGGATLPLMMVGGVAKNSADNAVLRASETLRDSFAGIQPQARPQSGAALAGGLATGAIPAAEQGQSAVRRQGSQIRRETR